MQSSMGLDCRIGVSPYPVGSGMSMIVDPAYAATLGSSSALADCYLTPEEIATDPEAAALAASFIAETANQLGVPPSQVEISGISLDSDNVPGCAPGYGPGDASGANLRSITIALDEAYTGRLGNPMSRADCVLTPSEIAADPQVARVARAFTGAACNLMDMGAASSTGCATGSGITVQRIQLVGCGDESRTVPDVTVQVSRFFSNALGSTSAYVDCSITTDELSPTGQDFVNQIIQNEAVLLGRDPSTISVDSISVDGDSTEGCGQNAGLSGGFGVTLDPDYLDVLHDGTALDDGTLDANEIANDADAAALAEAFRQTICDSLGLVDCTQVNIDGIDLQDPGGSGRRLAEGEWSAQDALTVRPIWSLANGDVMLRVKLSTV